MAQMTSTTLTVNGKRHTVTAHPDTPLLWVLREHLKITGTKYGCGVGQCGACLVHVDGEPRRSCMTRAGAVAGKSVTTIEGLAADANHAVQRAWTELDVVQCGYCQSGQIMSAAALIAGNPNPTDAEIDATLGRQLCRCGTYQRVRAAVHRAAELHREERK